MRDYLAMAEKLPQGVGEKKEGGRRDNFWLVIVIGLVVVTAASVLIGNLIAHKLLAAKSSSGISQDAGSISDADAAKRMDMSVEEAKKNSLANEEPTDRKERAQASVEIERQPSEPATTQVKIEIQRDESDSALPEETTKSENAKEQKQDSKSKQTYVEIEKQHDDLMVEETHPSIKNQAQQKAADEKNKAAESQKDQEHKTENQENVLYVLQLGVYSTRENAEHMRDALKAQYDLPIYISEDSYDSVVRYRIQVGAFKNKENAQKLGRELQMKGYTYYISTKPAND
jgi:cell division protein FtsN